MSDNAQLARTGAAGVLVVGGTAVTGWWLLAAALAVVAVGALCIRIGWGTRQKTAEVALNTAAVGPGPLPDDDTLRIPRLPVAKLLDPDTETTLTVAIPRQRTAWSPSKEGATR